MATFFSLARRNSYVDNFSSINKQEAAIDRGDQQPIDPWNLGVSTSTSTADTIAQQSSSDDILLSTNSPPTPEGLRPRKSIHGIRKDFLKCTHHIHERKVSHHLPTAGEPNSRPAEPLQGIHGESFTLPIRKSFSSFGRQTGNGILPPSFRRIDGSPINSASSFYEQSMEKSNNFNDEDFDISSSMEDSIFSRQPRFNLPIRQVAESPDLKQGGKPKTAVGAVLVAMAETSADQKETTKLDKDRYKSRVRSEIYHHRILPSRAWMDDQPLDDEYVINHQIDGDGTICDDSNQISGINDAGCDDDQSSLHASPSSLRRDILPTSWIDRQHQFLKDTSFTRRILNDETSSSRLEERSILDQSPYDFNPIMQEDIRSDPNRESINAPRLLSLVKDSGRLNLSAISNSHHQKDIESINTSLADTIEDEEEEYREIPMYYQALADDAPAQNVISDDAFIMTKAQNQTRNKEDLLRSTFERFQDCLDLLKEVRSQSSIDNSLFLGLGKTKAGTEYYRHMQALLLELQEGTSYGTQRRALLFCMSILQNAASFSNNTGDLHSKYSSSFPTYLSSPHWVPRPGFRSSLGLKEEPKSPQTIRGGDTSLFSLPSDSANDNTPHTSNLSMATTITTVVSPDKYGSVVYEQYQQASYFAPSDQNEGDIYIQDVRKTIDSLVRLLYRLEETCRDLKSKTKDKSKCIESIHTIYFDFLNVSSDDLRVIVKSFEMEFSEPQNLTRTVSNDKDAASLSPPPFHSSYQRERNINQLYDMRPSDTLRVSIVQSDNDDIDIDNRNQSIECDLWSPTTNDMMSLISPHSDEGNEAVTKSGYTELINDEPVDDLRRTIGSFDDDDVEDEREAPPSFDERERDHTDSFPATFARRIVPQRSRKSRFWKKRFLALKNRGRQATAE